MKYQNLTEVNTAIQEADGPHSFIIGSERKVTRGLIEAVSGRRLPLCRAEDVVLYRGNWEVRHRRYSDTGHRHDYTIKLDSHSN